MWVVSLKYFKNLIISKRISFRSLKMTEEAVNGSKTETCESSISLEEEVENGKNKYKIKCLFCPTKILNPGLGVYTETKFDLPVMKRQVKQSSANEVVTESLNHFWQINDIYTFENISFSNTVDNIKYLACADCEVGPVGYHNMDTKISYIALGRVQHCRSLK